MKVGKQDIKDRKDLYFIVKTFYDLLKVDTQIGPIFIEMIQDWDGHLEKITSFWEVQLFNIRSGYQGNPIQAHQKVDEAQGYSITPEDFGVWLFYWVNVINDNFEGEKAEELKDRARKMQTVLYLEIFKNRKNKENPLSIK